MRKINKNIIPITKNKLTKNEEHLKDFFNTYKFHKYTLSQLELSKLAFVSEATISRFVKKLDLKNYREFSIWFNNKLIEFHNKYKIIKQDDNPISLQNLIYSYKYIFEDMIANINFQILDKLSKQILLSKKIVIFGMGSSSRVAIELASNLDRMNINATTSTDFHTFVPLIGSANKTTLFIFISNNFENKELRWAVKKLVNKAELAIITSKELSVYENKWFNYMIKYSKMNNDFFGVPLSNKQGQWIIIDIIISLIFEKIKNEDRENFVAGMKLLKEWENT